MTWFDGVYFWLQAWKNEIAVGKACGNWYYSSDYEHLSACGVRVVDILRNGDTWRIDSDGTIEKSIFVGKATKKEKWDYTVTAGKSLVAVKSKVYNHYKVVDSKDSTVRSTCADSMVSDLWKDRDVDNDWREITYYPPKSSK